MSGSSGGGCGQILIIALGAFLGLLLFALEG